MKEYQPRFSDGFTSESLRSVNYRQFTKQRIDRYMNQFYLGNYLEYSLN